MASKKKTKVAVPKVIQGPWGFPETIYVDKETGKEVQDTKGYKIESEAASDGKKLAIPTLVRNESGTMDTVYVDSQTGQPVTSFADYKLYDQYSKDLETIGLKPPEKEDKKTGGKTKTEEEKEQNFFRVDDRRNDQNHPYGSGGKREMANNYGYVNRPGIVNAAGFIPGPLGMMGKAANLALNANNNAAVSRARDVLGLDDQLNVRGLLSDQKGYIGDINYNGVTSPVGFEAETKDGRTTLTPNEARMRKELSGITEATGKERRENQKDFRKENPRGILGRFIDTITSPAKDVIAGVGDSIQGKTSKREGTLEGPVESKRGNGIADLSPSYSGISYAHPDRGPVTKGLNPGTIGVMEGLAANTPGGIQVNSAYRSPEINRAVGGATDSLHSHGDAIDVSTAGMSKQEKRDLVERAIMSGAMEMGAYSNEGKGLHLAGRQRIPATNPELTGGVTAMYNSSRNNYDRAPDWYKDGIENSRLAAVPTARPDYFGSTQIANANNIDIDSGLGRAQGMDEGTRALMAATLAGEIDPSKTDLSTPQGRREAMGILSTMENRASRVGSIKAAITADNAYSTWGTDEAARVAGSNYRANKELFDGLVAEYAQDKQNNLGFTSYYNPSIVDPGWGAKMENPETIGPHAFGSLPEFGQNFGSAAPTNRVPTQMSLGTGVSATTKADLSPQGRADSMSGVGGLMSAENANRETNQSTAQGTTNRGGSSMNNTTNRGFTSSTSGSFSDRDSAGKSSSYSGGIGGSGSISSSSSRGSVGASSGFGVGGDRSSEGKSSYGGYGGSSGGSSKGSVGGSSGFGVGGDRSSEGKSSSYSSSSPGSKGEASRRDGWS